MVKNDFQMDDHIGGTSLYLDDQAGIIDSPERSVVSRDGLPNQVFPVPLQSLVPIWLK